MNTYTSHISTYDLAFLGAIFIGLTFAFLLGFTPRINRSANRFLALALVVMVLWMARIWNNDIRLPLQFSLTLGPLIYFYVLKLTRPEYKFRGKDLLHFIPVVLEQAILQNPVLPFLTFISVISYLYCAHQLIERFYRRLKFNGGDRYRNELHWLHRLLKGFGLLWLLGLPHTVVEYFYPSGANMYYPFYLGVAAMLVGIAAAAYLRPEVSSPGNLPVFLKPAIPGELKQKGNWLKNAMSANLYYRDPELSLYSLAEKLDMSPHELSRIINSVFKKSFNDFISEYRVRDVASKINDPVYDHITLLGIAYESGFNSKATFNRIFKQMTGKSPAEYKARLKKEVSSYNLRRYPQFAAVISNHETTPKWSHEKLNSNFMFKNYLKIAWRNMLRSKVYSALNIVGLATGMAVALLIGLWVFEQYSYDKFWPNYQQLYQVKLNFTDPTDGTHTQNAVSIPLANVLRTTIPGIKYAAETDWIGLQVHNLKVGEKKFLLNGGMASPDFLKIFQLSFVKGHPNTAFKDVYSVIINETTAKALFGDDDPINKTVRVDNQHDVKVTGVYKDLPKTANTQFSYLLPFSYKELTEDWMKDARTNWGNQSFEIWTELQPGVTQAEVEPKIKGLLVKYHPSFKDVKGEVILAPIKDQHLYSDYKNGKVVGGFIDYVRMFAIIGGLVLLIACINFMNLSTARSEKRAREVGVRKAIGSQRKDLIFQFLTESLMITFAAFLFSILLVQLALPYFNTLTGSSVSIPYGNLVFWGLMIAYVLVTGLLAGSRPAFYLSSFNPVKVLKGTIQIGKTASLPRKVLVVLQFSCSVALIISTVIIYQQIQHAKDRPSGYSAERLVSTGLSDDLANHYSALKNDLLQSHLVESVTKASSPLTGIYWHTGIDKWPGQKPGELGISIGGVNVDDNYFKTSGMKLVTGHDFSPDWASDTLNVIVNEAAVKRMGLKQPLNQLITYGGNNYQVRIVGVVQDALMENPFVPAEPTIFNHGRGGNYVIYRLSAGTNPHDAMDKIKKIFDKYNPAFPFEYVFVDKIYEAKFGLEVLIGKLAGIFAGLAVFISCLGLFGLAAYVAEQRTKEIGIRKVLGASIPQVWLLLSRDFILLVLISCVIASPVAFYYLHNWLLKYEYRIKIGPGVFLLSALMALIITLLTISFQAIKAALANPVRSLRSE